MSHRDENQNCQHVHMRPVRKSHTFWIISRACRCCFLQGFVEHVLFRNVFVFTFIKLWIRPGLKRVSPVQKWNRAVWAFSIPVAREHLLSPFSTLVCCHRWRNFSLAKNLFSCSLVPSAKGQTEDENFQRLDQQNKYLQRRMNVKKIISMSKFFAGGGEMMEWKTAFINALTETRSSRIDFARSHVNGALEVYSDQYHSICIP